MNEVIGEIIVDLLDVGIAGTVAVVACWYAWKERQEAKRVIAAKDEELKTAQRAKEKLIKELYERMLGQAEGYGNKVAGLTTELNQTVGALAESIEYADNGEDE